MKDSERKLQKRVDERRKFGGISGGQEKEALKYASIPAKIGGLGVVFDSRRYECEVQHEDDADSPTAYSIKAKDGREAYFEVDRKGKLYAFVCFGLNVELWRGLLVIGARSVKDDKKKRKRATPGR